MGRIRFGLSKAYYAEITAVDPNTGVPTYDTPAPLLGAVNLDMQPVGDSSETFADNVKWWGEEINSGYEGTFEFMDTAANWAFINNVLGRTTDTNGAVWESANDVYKEFALFGQFELRGGDPTDAVGRRVCFLRCSIGRTSVSGQTKENGVTVQTNSVNIKAMPRLDNSRTLVTADSTDTAYTNFFNAVPTFA